MRKSQRVMIEDIERVLGSGGHLVAEAPTGFGKTITALYPAAKYAIKYGKRIIYMVRTNSQQQKVIEEAGKLGISAVALQGRSNMCPLSTLNEELKFGNAEELSLLCAKLKKDVLDGNEDACPYFSGFLSDAEPLLRFIKEGHTAEEVFHRGKELGVCPYEATKKMMEQATVVVMPYIYFLVDFMRNMILDSMKTDMSELILIVDEAHNFPEFARELISDTLSRESLERMERECINHGNRTYLSSQCADIAEYMVEAIYRLEKYGDEDILVPQYAFEEEVAKLMNVGINDISRLGTWLMEYGTEIREMKMKQRKLPRSYIYSVGYFLHFWHSTYSPDFLHIARIEENPKLEIFCLDPSRITEIVRNAYSTIHMSGTLVLENYRRIINLPEESTLVRYPSPFSPDNLLVLYAKDVTTRYSELEKNVERIAKHITEIMQIRRNTIVFFPSYSLMHRISEHVSGEFMMETRGVHATTAEMLMDFRQRGGTIFSVFGGKLSEGIDFPGEQLEIVVIAGIPYPKPTTRVKMLEKYFDYKFGNGWDFAFREPALIKMRQAIGRLIRSEKDRGVAVILDHRAAKFAETIPMKPTEKPSRDIYKFFQE